MLRTRLVLSLIALCLAACGTHEAVKTDDAPPGDRVDVEPEPASLEKNEERIFEAQVTTRKQQTFVLRDCTVSSPEATFLGSGESKHEKVFRVSIAPKERTFLDGVLIRTRQTVLDQVVGETRPVPFSDIASIALDPVVDYTLPARITFRSRKRTGMHLAGLLKHVLRFDGKLAPFGLPTSVPLRDVSAIVFTEGAK